MKNKHSYEELYQLFVSVRRCANAVILARERELRKIGTTTGKASIMHAIDHYNGKASPGQIANFLALVPHTVVGGINRMEKEGLVRRKKGGPGAGRHTSVSLTKKGKALWRNVKKSRELVTQLFSDLSTEELEQLETYLNKMRDIAFEKSIEFTNRKIKFDDSVKSQTSLVEP